MKSYLLNMVLSCVIIVGMGAQRGGKDGAFVPPWKKLNERLITIEQLQRLQLSLI
jgi:hypothetical protein